MLHHKEICLYAILGNKFHVSPTNSLEKDHSWLAARGATFPAKNLTERMIIYASWCHICICTGEEVNHLLLHCKVTARLWWVVTNGVWSALADAKHCQGGIAT